MLKRVVPWVAVAGSAALVLSSSTRAQRTSGEGQWRNYAGDVLHFKFNV